MAEKIKFIQVAETSYEYRPVPANRVVPEWYKEMSSYVGGKKVPTMDGKSQGTIKKCMPVFDSITSGYLLLSPCDLYISKRDGFPYFQWSNSPIDVIEFHPLEQVELHPKKPNYKVPKFNNTWVIKTPPGYSCFFTTPAHRELPITILPGIVDTDTYSVPINFPFVLNDPNFEGYIYAGTPMVQVLPFKRTSWEAEHVKVSVDTARQAMQDTRELQSSWYEVYKSKWWHKKEYK